MLKRAKKLIITLAVALGILGTCFPVTSAGAINSTNLYAFPESYRPMISELMAKHPGWVFSPVETGLDFNDAVRAEADGRTSLVESSVSAWFKSSDVGDYNPATGSYMSKDSGWVAANEAAVAYFMDPRNLLTDNLVFQFESLSYDSYVHTEEGVEKILAGTFMSRAGVKSTSPVTGGVSGPTQFGQKPAEIIELEKENHLLNYGTYVCDICWNFFPVFIEKADGLYCPSCGVCLVSYVGEWSEYGAVDTTQPVPDTSGTYKTFAQVIMEAGKTYAISPYYLASKIVTEIGTSRSGSVTGTNSSYPEIYNFYNIGATSSSNAVLNGLAWAASGSSYNRPWNDEEKSIIGGAEFIAEQYISKGQNTIYYQRFNVSPRSTYKKYTHQYMTSTYSASTEARKTYNAYNGMSTLNDAKIFYVPVYDNMPDMNAGVSFSQEAVTGTLTSNAVLRSGADTSASQVRTIPAGTQVTINAGTITSAQYGTSNFLRFPYWYQVSCNVGGVNYSGYVCADFVKPDQTLYIAPGQTVKLPYYLTSYNIKEAVYFESSDYTVADVDQDGNVKVGSEGSCTIYAYTGGGAMAAISIVIGTDPSGGSFTGDGGGTITTPTDGNYSSPIFEAFTDVSGHWAEDYIKYTVYHGLYNGTSETTFSPETGMTRGMFVTVLGRLAGIDTSLYSTVAEQQMGQTNASLVRMRSGPSTSFAIVTECPIGTVVSIEGSKDGWYLVSDGANRGYIRNDLLDIYGGSDALVFTDVDPNQYYAPYIRWAAENGVVGGHGDGTFGPDDQITREQMAIIICNYASSLGIHTYLTDLATLHVFADYQNIHDWAQYQVAWAVANGIAEGKDGGAYYEPVMFATRGEVASVMAKFMMKYLEG
ncbi:MAG: S-layer homology domain-containing protein [Oscillospiraceae bacterium]|nr:S-layer homology domain-containing protein [Oscillospiraceae bacterium]